MRKIANSLKFITLWAFIVPLLTSCNVIFANPVDDPRHASPSVEISPFRGEWIETNSTLMSQEHVTTTMTIAESDTAPNELAIGFTNGEDRNSGVARIVDVDGSVVASLRIENGDNTWSVWRIDLSSDGQSMTVFPIDDGKIIAAIEEQEISGSAQPDYLGVPRIEVTASGKEAHDYILHHPAVFSEKYVEFSLSRRRDASQREIADFEGETGETQLSMGWFSPFGAIALGIVVVAVVVCGVLITLRKS